MSFGKQEGHVQVIAAQPGSAAQMNNAKNRSGGSGGGSKGPPYFVGNYKPNDKAVDMVRLIPGNFQTQRLDDNGNIYIEVTPWLEVTEHYHGGLHKGCICSGGPFRNNKSRKEPCYACDIFWEDYMKRKDIENQTGVKPKGPNRVSKRDLMVFFILDTGYYFKGTSKDEHGNPRKGANGQTFTEWIKYNGSPQHHQEAHAATERRNGRILPWVVGRDQFSFLSTYSDIISANCAGCGAYGTIHSQRWSCEKCNADILNPQQAGMSQEQVNAIVHKPCACNNCRHVGYPREAVACTNCQTPRRATLYDATIPLRGSKNNENKTQLMTPGNAIIGPIGPQFLDLLEDLPDLVKKFAATPVADQQSLFTNGGPEHSGNSGQNQDSGPPAQPYGQGQPGLQNPPPGYQQNYQQPQPQPQQQPVYTQPQYAPQQPHIQPQPQPVYATQQPVYAQPQPAQGQPPQYQQQPVYAQPQYQQPQPQQQPQYAQPQPAAIPGGYNPNGYQGQ